MGHNQEQKVEGRRTVRDTAQGAHGLEVNLRSEGSGELLQT